jgi:hypothetical protein
MMHIPESPADALAAVLDVRRAVLNDALAIRDMLTTDCHRRAFAISASNLASYLALRSHDLRPLQAALAPLGVSTLGHSESSWPRLTPWPRRLARSRVSRRMGSRGRIATCSTEGRGD